MSKTPQDQGCPAPHPGPGLCWGVRSGKAQDRWQGRCRLGLAVGAGLTSHQVASEDQPGGQGGHELMPGLAELGPRAGPAHAILKPSQCPQEPVRAMQLLKAGPARGVVSGRCGQPMLEGPESVPGVWSHSGGGHSLVGGARLLRATPFLGWSGSVDQEPSAFL